MSVGLGCAAVSHYVTPAKVDQEALDYAVAAGIADPNSYDGYPNLVKATALKEDVDAAHSVIQFDLRQQMQKDDLKYSIHIDAATDNVQDGLRREEMMFGQEGLLSMGLSLVGVGGFAGVLGLMRKRPGDVTPAELGQVVQDVTGDTEAALSDKHRQFKELVLGISSYMKTLTDEQSLPLKAALNSAEDTDTRIAVSTLKRELNL
jgi:hypothetical protein